MANQILSSDVLPRINDFPCLGMIQNVSWQPAFNAQDIFELGRDTKVASALELETNGSMEAMSIGATPNILSRMMLDRNVTTDAFEGYLYGEPAFGPVTASSGTTTTITTTGLTASGYIGMIVRLISGTGAGQSRIITANSTTVITVGVAFSPAPDATTVIEILKRNARTLTQNDMKECVFDLVLHERPNQTDFTRSTALPRCFLTSLSGRADANGAASETYNFAGDFVVVANQPYHYLRAVPATRTTSGTATLADTTIAQATWELAYFYIDEVRLTKDATLTEFAVLGAAGLITVTGRTIPVTARLSALVFDDTTPSTVYPVVNTEDRGTSSFFERGYMVDLYIAPANDASPTANEKWLKVQSIDWNVDLRTDALRQIAFNAAGTAIYCRLPQFPLDISMNASVYEADLADWQAILNPTVKPFGGTGTNFYTETFDFSINSLKSQFAVVLQYRTTAGTLLQTWRFQDMRLESYSKRINVGGRSEVQWSMRGTQFTLVGFNG